MSSKITVKEFKNIIDLCLSGMRKETKIPFRYKIIDIPKFYIIQISTDTVSFEDRIYKDNLKDIFRENLETVFIKNIVTSVERRIKGA